jgi:hypothetical protein
MYLKIGHKLWIAKPLSGFQNLLEYHTRDDRT